MDPVADDPYLWLEDITGDDALNWVREHNAPTLGDLVDDRFEQMRSEALEVLDTDSRIPYVRRRGDYLYNFWRDATNPRGLWRRTTLESYRSEEPAWDVIIDVDEVARLDDENWVWAGAEVIEPDYTLALVELSRGGADATVVREFDMEKREFVDGGFQRTFGVQQLGPLVHFADRGFVDEMVGQAAHMGHQIAQHDGAPRVDQTAVRLQHPETFPIRIENHGDGFPEWRLADELELPAESLKVAQREPLVKK